MSYHLPKSPLHPRSLGTLITPEYQQPVSSGASTGKMIGIGLLVVGGVGLIGFLLYHSIKLRGEIVKKHGVGGLLAYEGGSALISTLLRNER